MHFGYIAKAISAIYHKIATFPKLLILAVSAIQQRQYHKKGNKKKKLLKKVDCRRLCMHCLDLLSMLACIASPRNVALHDELFGVQTLE